MGMGTIMPTQSNLQRWISIALIGMLLGLVATHGVPAIAYRVSQAIHRGKAAAQSEGLDQRIASLHDTSAAFRTISERVKPAVVYVTARVLELDIQSGSPRLQISGVQRSACAHAPDATG